MGSGFQEMLGQQMSVNNLAMLDTNVDIVFVIDGTGSMQPLIDKVKSLTLRFRDELEQGLQKNKRKIAQLRVKVIVFRDFYVDDVHSIEESRFFTLPEETQSFHSFVSNIRADGGGDEPESGLEALALAMRSDFVQKGDKRRHIIVLFTDASAHPLEQQEQGIPQCYPFNMFRSLSELKAAWQAEQTALGGSDERRMKLSKDDKRLVLFAPKAYPWDTIEDEWSLVAPRKSLDKGAGGKDLDLRDVISMISSSIQ